MMSTQDFFTHTNSFRLINTFALLILWKNRSFKKNG